MKINLHIDRLVLHGLSISHVEQPLLQAVVETELTQLLLHGGLNNTLEQSGTLYNIRTTDVELTNDGGPVGWGQQIAAAVYKGIGI